MRYANYKSEMVMSLSKAFEVGLVYDYPYSSKYTLELLQWQSTIMSDRKIKIEDPEEKSPDFADSLVIAFDATNPKAQAVHIKSSLF